MWHWDATSPRMWPRLFLVSFSCQCYSRYDCLCRTSLSFRIDITPFPACPFPQSCSSLPPSCRHFLSRRLTDLFIASLSPLTPAERWHHSDESMGRFRLLWLSLFILFYSILFHCSECPYTILWTARGKKVRVAYIDFSRLTHCQVVVGQSAEGSGTPPLGIIRLLKGDYEIVTSCLRKNAVA
jgi:hypothetical protein